MGIKAAVSGAGVFVALLAQSANAQERVLQGMGGGTSIAVWKNQQALREGTDLLSAGIHKRNPELVTRLIACIVPAGTKAIVTDDPSLGIREILVTSGEFLGCRVSVNVETIVK